MFLKENEKHETPSFGILNVFVLTSYGCFFQDDVVCLGVSDRGGSSGVAFSPRPSKRMRKAGKDPQLLPRSAIESQQQVGVDSSEVVVHVDTWEEHTITEVL